MVFTARELTFIRQIHEVWYKSGFPQVRSETTVCQLQCGHIVKLDGAWYAGESVVCETCKRQHEQTH